MSDQSGPAVFWSTRQATRDRSDALHSPDRNSRGCRHPPFRPAQSRGPSAAWAHGLYAIAEHLTRDGIACPSAHDPARNSHRCGVAWSKYAIRAILTNPRYTGRQVWNKQRKDEVLIDVHDVALGHTTKQRWNDADEWIYSEQVVHPAIIGSDTFSRAQDLLIAPPPYPLPAHKTHPPRH